VLGLFEPIHRDQDGRVRYHFVVVDFLARYHSGELRAGDDAAELRWARPAELDLFALNPATRAMIDRSLALLDVEDQESHDERDPKATA
jgi:8-oxo-dGTP diphosphatase